MSEKLLIVDDEEELLHSCQRILQGLDLEILTANSGEEALSVVAAEKPGIILTDLRMPKMDGHALTNAALGIDKEILVVVMTGQGTVETAVQTIKQGAFDFITKPFSSDQLRVTIARAMEKRYLVSQNRSLRSQLSAWRSMDKIVGQSPKLLKIFDLVKKVAPSDASVLVLGESGTGKELVARSIHSHSRRADKPFVAIDCASLPENLLESELFGYEKGAFTGAMQTKPGLLESAQGGTVFLDEVGELPVGIQAKLLRVLQERMFRRIGGTREMAVDIRVVAATNRNLRGLVLDKAFREDLFYRLNVIN
ncbi:MAG TPA: sigma-54 dependent transcriptional regulator, partial [Verrucomicrobiae bacterium]|nr:sigma-54 dependent transcriptional regulator [Verrucomicrobiae bacterium]